MASRFLAVAASLLLITEALDGQARRLPDRIRDYVARFEREASALVAEERYVQQLEKKLGTSRSHTTRTLRSDYVLVKPAESEPWIGYRDIFEVDGQPVRERDTRLVDLLTKTPPDSRERAIAFVTEGARFNLGPERTVNTPTMPLQLLSKGNAGRIRVQTPPGWERKETVEVQFRETSEENTIVRTPQGHNVLSWGFLTVRVSDGAILSARLHFRFLFGRRDEASMRVEYGPLDDIVVPVPTRMLETIPMPDGKASGDATYSNYRRFQTSARIR